MKKYYSLNLLIFFHLICITPLSADNIKIVTDMDGNKVEVPVNPKKIANLHGPSFDRIIMLGKVDRLALISLEASPWANKLYPQIKNIPIMKSYIDVDVEQMLKHKVELVFYSLHAQPAEKLNLVGIKTANAFAANKRPKTIPEFIDNFKNQIKFFGEVLGQDAKIKAEKYCQYYDKVMSKVLLITSKININKRPNVYYAMSEDLFSTQGKDTIMQWYTVIAGGIFLTQNIDKDFPKVSMEQIISWNPDIILIGYHASDKILTKKSNWSDIKAVKNKNIYRMPKGIFLWDLGSGESVLLPLYLAKKFHPELFKDWDLIKEMKKFYAEIYEKKITTLDAERILQGLPPI